ncbi:MAG: hypothetical protein R3Y46_03300 [Opitutales bacterium]
MKKFYIYILSLFLVACSSTEIPVEQSEPAQKKEVHSISLAQRQLLDIIAEQNQLFETYKEDSQDKLILAQMNTKYKKIVSKWQNYISQYPEDIDAIIIYGKFLRAVGEFANAYKAFLEVDKINPNIAVVKQQLASFEGDYGMYKEALIHIKKAIELSPDEAIYYYQLAELLCVYYKDFLRENIYTQEAINLDMENSFEKAISLDPKNLHLYWRYAQSFYQQSDASWQKALKAWDSLEPFVYMNLEKSNVLLNKARVLIELYRDEEALVILNNINTPSFKKDKDRLIAIIKAQETGDTKMGNSLKKEENERIFQELKKELQDPHSQE